MRYILSILLLLSGISFLSNTELIAQDDYQNDWIEYDKSYLRIKVAKDGLHKIDFNTLSTYSVPEDMDQYKMFHKGREIPIYFDSDDATFSTGDKIEFYGERNDGEFDRFLYTYDAWQPHEYRSLFSDTSVYYLVWDPSYSGERYEDTANEIIDLPPPPETHFEYESVEVIRNIFFPGQPFRNLGGVNNYFADYGEGEGFVGSLIQEEDSKTYDVETPSIYTDAGGTAKVECKIVGQSDDFTNIPDHHVQILLSGNIYVDTLFEGYDMRTFNFNVPVDELVDDETEVTFSALADSSIVDKISGVYAKITYPHSYNFDNKRNYRFTLPNDGVKYIEITNFNGGSQPALYDITNNQRIEPVVDDSSGDDVYKFMLYPVISGPQYRQLYFTNTTSSLAVTTVEAELINQTQFTDFSETVNQGDYIILSHPQLQQGSTDHVQAYADYRSTEIGGGYNPIIVNVDELYDQFAWGIGKHPLSISQFVNYAIENWNVTPSHLLLLGKGVEYNKATTDPNQYNACLVPSWGHRASDVQLSTSGITSYQPQLATGRVPAQTPEHVRIYLDKVIEYEAYKPCTKEDRLWYKQAMHIAGGNNYTEAAQFLSYLDEYKPVYEDSLMGGEVIFTYAKTTEGVEEAPEVQELFNQGVGVVSFIGHSSGAYWDVALGEPTDYTNYGKYPLIISGSCFIGNLQGPTSADGSMSEDYVLADGLGSIGFLAPVSFGFPTQMDIYLSALYDHFCLDTYDLTFGESIVNAIEEIYIEDETQAGHKGVKLTVQQYTLAGDPALRISAYDRPEYHIETSDVFFNPPASEIDATLDSFAVNVVVWNLGSGIQDSIDVTVERTFPDGSNEQIIRRFQAPVLSDTLTVYVQTGDPSEVAGENYISIQVDSGFEIEEDCEDNNLLSNFQVYIFSDLLEPIAPCNFSIATNPDITLKAATGRPLLSSLPYRIEIDTTEKFNSPLLEVEILNSPSGVIEWQPEMSWEDDQVYYWRTSQIPSDDGSYNWRYSSFVYLADGEPGWNQSHFYQFQKDSYHKIVLDSLSRDFRYTGPTNRLTIDNNRYGTNEILVTLNNTITMIGQSCLKNDCNGGITVVAFSPDAEFLPLTSVQVNPEETDACLLRGTFGNNQCGSGEKYGLEYYTGSVEQLDNLTNLFDNQIPDGYYVLAYSVTDHRINTTDTDEPILSGYQDEILTFFENMGIEEPGAVSPDQGFIYLGRKNMPGFAGKKLLGEEGSLETFTMDEFIGHTQDGRITSTTIGPSLEWGELIWDYESLEAADVDIDEFTIDLYGLDTQLSESFLFNAPLSDMDLSSINANEYPFLKLVAQTADTAARTVPQLQHWRVHYQQAGEIALNYQSFFSFESDTLQEGEPVHLQYALDNAGSSDMDSILVQYDFINSNDTTTVYKKHPPIAAGSSIIADFSHGTEGMLGNNLLEVTINPDLDQLEKFNFNNKFVLSFVVVSDQINPIVDVTFDGQHILDGELVSAKPEIAIRIKDENQYLALNDTSDFKLFLRYPDENGEPATEEEIPFNSEILTFVEANLTEGVNEAYVTLNPTFLQDGYHELIVEAQDRSDNSFAGEASYKVRFNIITAAMISKMVNYPNPFTSSTRFVFTLTGSEIPEFLKIQIMTVNGTVVREILKDELGPLQIGDNITEFAWDGTDQYGSPLANGVYLYRMVTSLAGDGQQMDEYTAPDINDYFSKRGVGKMYLMR